MAVVVVAVVVVVVVVAVACLILFFPTCNSVIVTSNSSKPTPPTFPSIARPGFVEKIEDQVFNMLMQETPLFFSWIRFL